MHSSFPNSSENRTRLGFTARYVPTCVKVYPDCDTVEEYGTVLSLKDYGTVLVSGEDTFSHNRKRDKSLSGYDFALAD